MNEYILVNLPRTFLTGGWKVVHQKTKVVPYFDHIIKSTWDYDHTVQCLKELGFKSGSGGKNIDGSWGAQLLCEILPEDRKKYKTITLSEIIAKVRSK
tara:strand:+ start:132 stop:425 length:294 start_codon:yes stop_codon:yes gene_type:complete